MARRIVMLGAPASGKGTQTARLASQFGIPQLSTGALIRAEQASGSELGRAADLHLAGGGFLPDEIMIGIVDAWLVEHGEEGFVLDGYPRTQAQAEALEGALEHLGESLDAAVLLRADQDLIMRRVADRLHCSTCGGTFRRSDEDSQLAGSACPKEGCGGELAARSDDMPGDFSGRLANFLRLTQPLIDRYRRQEKLVEIDARDTPDEVFSSILRQLGAAETPTQP